MSFSGDGEQVCYSPIMPAEDLAADAARHAIRLGIGFTTVEEVIRWADELVLAQPVVNDAVIALASAFPAPGWVVLDRVKALTTREALVDALRDAAGEVCSLHAQGALSLRVGVEHLLRWAQALKLSSDAAHRELYWTLDGAAEELDLADRGIFRHEDVERPIIDALRRLAVRG